VKDDALVEKEVIGTSGARGGKVLTVVINVG
jgi:sporulation protein YlmC with PRC-barrel domain